MKSFFTKLALLILLSTGCFAQEKPLLLISCPMCYTDSVDENHILYRSANGILSSSMTKNFTEPSVLITIDRILCFNCSIEMLYEIAFFNKMDRGGNDIKYFHQSNRKLWDNADSTVLKFRAIPYPNFCRCLSSTQDTTSRYQFLRDRTFCYQIKLSPLTDMDEKHQDMLQDLNYYFGKTYNINVEMKTRKVKYRALTRTDKSKKIEISLATSDLTMDSSSLIVKGFTIEDFLQTLADNYLLGSSQPLLNQTNYYGNIQVSLRGNLSNLNELNMELGKYGLTLKETEKELKMIVIKQMNKK
jgi:hypothetical protein